MPPTAPEVTAATGRRALPGRPVPGPAAAPAGAAPRLDAAARAPPPRWRDHRAPTGSPTAASGAGSWTRTRGSRLAACSESSIPQRTTAHFTTRDQVSERFTHGSATRVDTLIGRLPNRAWKRLSCGDGAHGPRRYDWAATPIHRDLGLERRGWVLARRSI